ncbi:MAG: H-NS histone family protein, partial [Bradyrhizobiaceae bacterium]
RYRGPAGETWSGGRGRKPRWVSEALAAGKSLSDFEIK